MQLDKRLQRLLGISDVEMGISQFGILRVKLQALYFYFPRFYWYCKLVGGGFRM